MKISSVIVGGVAVFLVGASMFQSWSISEKKREKEEMVKMNSLLLNGCVHSYWDKDEDSVKAKNEFFSGIGADYSFAEKELPDRFEMQANKDGANLRVIEEGSGRTLYSTQIDEKTLEGCSERYLRE